jgi:hypothetical protein
MTMQGNQASCVTIVLLLNINDNKSPQVIVPLPPVTQWGISDHIQWPPDAPLLMITQQTI